MYPKHTGYIQEKHPQFGVWDYGIFAVILIAYTVVGIYFAFKKKGTEDVAAEYLMGGRKMSVIPISLSLIASWVSSVILLGTPTEMYFYGTKYMFICLGLIPAAIASAYVFLPVFFEMKLSSIYEYLETRFDKKVRLYGSVAFILLQVGWLPIDIYAPALIFNQVTGIDVNIISVCVCAVCIFYTTIGGMKAVLWTDVIKTLIMTAAVILVVVKGAIDIGGLDVIWGRSKKGDRVEFPSFELDFTDRHTFWSVTIGGGMYYLQAAFIDQWMTQRYMSLPTLVKMKRAVWSFTIGTIFFTLLSCFSGLVLYATYYDCDPFTNHQVEARDQMLPLFAMHVLGDYPGLPGFFVAGLFSASLSTLSTVLNSVAAVILEDFVKALYPNKTLSDRATNIIMQSVVILFGALCVALVFVVEKLGTIVQLTMSISAVTSGSYFGIFCGGMLLPWMNADGAFYGALLGLAASGFVILGAQYEIAAEELIFPTKPLSVDGCGFTDNASYIAYTNIPSAQGDVFPLFKMSYLWYTLFGGIVTLISSILISYFTGFNDPSDMNPLCMSPVIRRFLPKRKIEENEEMSTL